MLDLLEAFAPRTKHASQGADLSICIVEDAAEHWLEFLRPEAHGDVSLVGRAVEDAVGKPNRVLHVVALAAGRYQVTGADSAGQGHDVARRSD